MKKNYTHIDMVLDASGSMSSILNDTLGGVNTFIKGQQETAQDFDTFSLIQFSTGPVRVIHKNANIKNVQRLSTANYIPGGGTALYDAVGSLIKDTGAYFRSLPESERPSKVFFVIVTDGEENSSQKFSQQQIADLIKDQTETWKWEFVFLGANQDAILAAKKMNIGYNNSMTYGISGQEIKATYDGLTSTLNSSKLGGAAVNFSAEIRSASYNPSVVLNPAPEASVPSSPSGNTVFSKTA